MSYTELTGKYRRLRGELEAAYAAPVWDRHHIDRIADELTETELALASSAPQSPVDVGATKFEAASC